MDAESEYEINRARDAVQTIQTIQSMIDVSADRLEGLRTQCSTSAELTQQEIRTLEGKLVKHFSRQLVIKARFGEELQRELGDVPRLPQWLRVVGLCPESIEAICSRVPSLEALRERSERELRALLANARDDEARRLCGAMHRLRTYTDALARGENSIDMQLYWDSWERHGHARASPRTRPRHRGSVPGDDLLGSPLNVKSAVRGPATPVSRRKDSVQTSLPAPVPGAPLTKSRSHESQLCVRPDEDLSDNSQSSTLGTGGGPEHTPPSSPPREVDTPHHKPHANNTNVSVTAPRSPRTPTVNPCMTHDIAHRFTKTFNMIATCDYCDKQMLFGSGLKCKECKFKCHRDCESKVPPSCGLPPEFVSVFRERFQKDGMHNHGGAYPSPMGTGSPVDIRTCVSNTGLLSSLTHRRRRWPHPHGHAHLPANAPPNALAGGGPDSSSNTSSCNSSTPSSPALAPPAPATPHPPPTTTKHQQFHFPDVKTPPVSSPSMAAPRVPPPPAVNSTPDNKEDLTSSVKSDSSRCVSLSGSASTDSERATRADSLDDANNVADSRWPRQNSTKVGVASLPLRPRYCYKCSCTTDLRLAVDADNGRSSVAQFTRSTQCTAEPPIRDNRRSTLAHFVVIELVRIDWTIFCLEIVLTIAVTVVKTAQFSRSIA
ncbi:Kinase suppressor of Ras 1 [Eumeta japonica]|uniref:Kinase suppressor of Ras 1 n=1 Tax=Eumeta variegata TaxID=151549 RepID=A0A4C1XB34_EUMVA|nr:Kinase suppressor of Ras 1 [Eumeta japonica]